MPYQKGHGSAGNYNTQAWERAEAARAEFEGPAPVRVIRSARDRAECAGCGHPRYAHGRPDTSCAHSLGRCGCPAFAEPVEVAA